MDGDRLSALMARGMMAISDSRATRAIAVVTRRRTGQISRELHAIVNASNARRESRSEIVPHPVVNASEPAWLNDIAYYRMAEIVIDQHGRWARHVVLQRAIDQVMAGDAVGERIWRRVFNAVLALQRRPRDTLMTRM